MCLVENDQPPALRAEIRDWIVETSPVGRILQIEINGFVAALLGQFQGKGGFSRLARTEQRHGWKLLEPVF